MPRISVLVCTRDRSESLDRTLASLEHQSLDAGAFEIIVVDNGSTDDTEAIVAARAAHGANLRYVLHPEVGLSSARNRALREARGEILAILDDDAVAASDWVERMAAAFDRHPLAGAVGGRIELVWPEREPSWISEETATLYARLDAGDVERELKFPETPFGSNFGLRAKVVAEVGGFSIDLGRVGASLISGEEGELCLRMQEAGYLVIYDPHVEVGHHVLPARVSKRWLLRRSYDQGRTRAIAQAVRGVRPTRAAWLRLLSKSAIQTFGGPVWLSLKVLTLQVRASDVMDAAVRSTMTFACALEAGRYMVGRGGRRYAPRDEHR